MYERQEGGAPARSGISLRLILFLVLGAAAIVFVVQNSDTVRLNFLMFEFRAPEWLIFVILLAAGALLGRLVQYQRSRKRARTGAD